MSDPTGPTPNTECSPRFVIFETFNQSGEKTLPKYKDNGNYKITMNGIA